MDSTLIMMNGWKDSLKMQDSVTAIRGIPVTQIYL